MCFRFAEGYVPAFGVSSKHQQHSLRPTSPIPSFVEAGLVGDTLTTCASGRAAAPTKVAPEIRIGEVE